MFNLKYFSVISVFLLVSFLSNSEITLMYDDGKAIPYDPSNRLGRVLANFAIQDGTVLCTSYTPLSVESRLNCIGTFVTESDDVPRGKTSPNDLRGCFVTQCYKLNDESYMLSTCLIDNTGRFVVD